MRIKYINLVLAIVFCVGLSIFTPNKVEAAFRAGPGTGSIEVICALNCGSDTGKLQLVGYRGILDVSVYSRPFNFIRSDNNGNLLQNANIPIGSTLNYTNANDQNGVPLRATGTWIMTGGGYDTPDMGTGRYEIQEARVNLNPAGGVAGIAVARPATSNPSSIVGSGAVSCNGGICTANSSGNASIKIIFPAGSAQARAYPKYPNQDIQCRGNGNIYDCKEDIEYISYGAQSTTIYFTVYQPNRVPVVSNCSLQLTGAGYNTARASWEYSDADGDTQSRFRILDFSNDKNIIRQDIQINNNAATSYEINELLSGATYDRIKIQVYDGRVWSQPISCNSITTNVNNPPNLEDLSCTVSNLPNNNSNKYTKAKLNWNYTGTDEPEDRLILKARWKISEEAGNDWRVKRLDNQSGNINLNNLIPGNAYTVEVSVNDNSNAYLGDRWKDCGIVTQPDYPKPNVEFSLSSGEGTASLDGTLNINTGDLVNANWSITNEIGVIDNSCRLITTRISGDLDADIFDNNKGDRGLSGNIAGQNLPVSSTDQEYRIELKCDGKDAKTKRNISESITLVVQSVPTVSCSIQDNKNLVKEGNTSIKIIAQVGNVIGYNWEAGVNNNSRNQNNQTGSKSVNTNLDTLTIQLTYNGTAFGRYTPWIKITNQSNSKTAEAECGTVTNLGDSNIREISP